MVQVMVTVTGLEQFRRCEWQSEFNAPNAMNLEPAVPLPALILGTLIHTALDKWAKDSTLNPVKVYKIYAGQEIERLSSVYASHMDGLAPSGIELRPIYDDLALGQSMIENYYKHYHYRALPPELEFVSTEQQIVVTLPNTNHCACATAQTCTCPRPRNAGPCRPLFIRPQDLSIVSCTCQAVCTCRQDILLEGKIDGLVRHLPTGNLYVLDNKTFTKHPQAPTPYFVGELARTHQFTGYCWIAQAINLPVAGFLYNGLWKRATVPNKRTEDDLFHREYVNYSSNAMDNWATQAAVTALHMIDPYYTRTRTVHPVGGCSGVNQCSYLKLCDARYNGHSTYSTMLSRDFHQRQAVIREDNDE